MNHKNVVMAAYLLLTFGGISFSAEENTDIQTQQKIIHNECFDQLFAKQDADSLEKLEALLIVKYPKFLFASRTDDEINLIFDWLEKLLSCPTFKPSYQTVSLIIALNKQRCDMKGIVLESKLLERLAIDPQIAEKSFCIIFSPDGKQRAEFFEASHGLARPSTRALIEAILSGVPIIASACLLENIVMLNTSSTFPLSIPNHAPHALKALENWSLYLNEPENDFIIFIPKKNTLPHEYGFSDQLKPYSFHEITEKLKTRTISDNPININNLFKVFDKNYPKKRRFCVTGHGVPGIIAELSLQDTQKLMMFFNQTWMNTEFLFLQSCHAAGTNLRDLQHLLLNAAGAAVANIDLEPLERQHLALTIKKGSLQDWLNEIKYEKDKRHLVKQVKAEIEAIDQQLKDVEPQNIMTMHENSHLPQQESTQSDHRVINYSCMTYPIVIQGIADVSTISRPNLGRFLAKLDCFLMQTTIRLDKKNMHLAKVMNTFYDESLSNVSLVRWPNAAIHFRPVCDLDLSHSMILDDVFIKRVLLDFFMKSKLQQQALDKKELAIEIPQNKRTLLVYGADVTHMTLNIAVDQIKELSRFISMMPGQAYHYINKVQTRFGDRLAIINQLFLQPISHQEYDVSEKIWFLNSLIEDHDATVIFLEGNKTRILISVADKFSDQRLLYILKDKKPDRAIEKCDQIKQLSYAEQKAHWILLPLDVDNLKTDYYFEKVDPTDVAEYFLPIHPKVLHQSLVEASSTDSQQDITQLFYETVNTLFGQTFESLIEPIISKYVTTLSAFGCDLRRQAIIYLTKLASTGHAQSILKVLLACSPSEKNIAPVAGIFDALRDIPEGIMIFNQFLQQALNSQNYDWLAKMVMSLVTYDLIKLDERNHSDDLKYYLGLIALQKLFDSNHFPQEMTKNRRFKMLNRQISDIADRLNQECCNKHNQICHCVYKLLEQMKKFEQFQ